MEGKYVSFVWHIPHTLQHTIQHTTARDSGGVENCLFLSSPLLLTCTAQTTRSWFEDTLMHVTRSRLSPVFSRFNNTNGSLLSSVRSYTEKYLKWMMDSIVKYVNATV